jgi:hypothetical protein
LRQSVEVLMKDDQWGQFSTDDWQRAAISLLKLRAGFFALMGIPLADGVPLGAAVH